ncbi:NADH-quinone oxidoreductase subunit N [Mucilaginibacter sp. 44-25]|uniref:NADH-quinone oxidoreductase subunit N n=1 Tax=Mucilaginibacter sp. 44-25 TaxID=1895794 RepID=UPI000961E6B2|nr:NADH-quinone oxidoreductase subunit N [Mucilaginibacter sp. 44-25]OJW17575.1 MAG: NADH dehydrogenase [Mucilaginibacter sp. 44-25]
MTSIIIISILPIVLLYLGLYKAQKALLPVAVLGLLAALVTSVMQWKTNAVPEFNGMLLYDNFSVAFSVISIITTVLILLLSKGYFERISNHIAEYYAIILFSLAGILVMVSYHNITMLFIGIEIMSVSLYILAGIRKNDFASNEAALKYFLMGAFSTGFLLFGIALIYGSTGTFDLDGIRDWVLMSPRKIDPLFYTGIMLIIVGLCFKVGAAPFHFWTPDVYEGAPSLITLFMSTVVKVAGFAAFLRLFSACFLPIAQFWTPVLLVITTLTLFIGNITALYQQSFKRMLAFSSISHAGYLLFAIVAIGAGSANSIFVYATAYSIASVIAFGALILVRQQSGTDNFEGFNGLAARNPFLALVLTISMLSLAGIPLTAGFIGKFYMFSGALSQYRVWLVVVAIVNAIISIFYYFRVIIAMYFRSAEREQVEIPAYYKLVLGFSALVTIVIGVYPAIVSGLI